MIKKQNATIPSKPNVEAFESALEQIRNLTATAAQTEQPENSQPMTDTRRALLERQRIELLAITISEIRAISTEAERAMAEFLLLERGLTLNQTAQLTRFSTASLSTIRSRPQFFDTELPNES
ncbi:hypothetical protein [Microbacterium sp.]|uniref:hypothetical protein n=1 Tax=Microbacterium sp. TaxID=51671 RepID=UPI003F9C1E9A